MAGEERVYLNSRTRPYYLRRCKRGWPTNIESLPDELLSDILVRLSADYLHDRARLVCRRWYHIIHSDAFVNTQFHHSTYELLLSNHCHRGNYPISVTVSTQGRIETREFGYRCTTRLYTSCIGLALGFNTKAKLLQITNPATKQALVLPWYSGKVDWPKKCGIAYAADSMVYKAVIPFQDVGVGDTISVSSLAILTVGVDESWRNVGKEQLSRDDKSFFCRYPLTTEGFIHWTIERFWMVLTLDVETEIFTRSIVPLPQPQAYRNMYYLSTGRFLSLLAERRYLSWEIWGMKPGNGTWSKLLPVVELGGEKCRLQQFGLEQGKELTPVGWVKYPEVLALRFYSKGRTWIFYNLYTHEINSTILPESCVNYSANVHKNNLKWLS